LLIFTLRLIGLLYGLVALAGLFRVIVLGVFLVSHRGEMAPSRLEAAFWAGSLLLWASITGLGFVLLYGFWTLRRWARLTAVGLNALLIVAFGLVVGDQVATEGLDAESLEAWKFVLGVVLLPSAVVVVCLVPRVRAVMGR
jgi:hypothetical protein